MDCGAVPVPDLHVPSTSFMGICNLDVEESRYAEVAMAALLTGSERASVVDAELRSKSRDSFA
jgi:hypothetical protein